LAQIVWTEKASTHLKAIHDYIAEDSPVYALGFVKALVKATNKLERFPLAGRSVPEFEQTSLSLREVVFRGYRIVHQVTSDDIVEILTVAHGREDMSGNFNKDWVL
jgi:plasmid stabilization system protein ParE